MTSETIKQYQDEMGRKRRIQQQALAILRRAKNSGIPPQDMRIPEDEFLGIMDSGYFEISKGITSKEAKIYAKNLCHELFTIPSKLFGTPFIILDGGNFYERRRAGFALLFRMIAWDKNGKHIPCIQAVHALQTWAGSDGQNRIEIASDLKEYDTLFISECSSGHFRAALEGGGFFDEVLQERESEGKVTILSFTNLIPSKGFESVDKVSDTVVGQYMSMFSESDSDKSEYKNMLRIRVKTNG